MGKYHCTVDLLFYWFGISCMTTDNFCFYLQNRLIQTNQTGGQWYSDTTITNATRNYYKQASLEACTHCEILQAVATATYFSTLVFYSRKLL